MSSGSHRALALTARVSFLESLIQEVDAMVLSCLGGAKNLAAQASVPAVYQRRRDLVLDFPRSQSAWLMAMQRHLQSALQAARLGRPAQALSFKQADEASASDGLSLLDDSSVERDLVAVRLGQAVGDLTGSEFSDLNARLQSVDGAVEWVAHGAVPVGDVLSPNWLARVVVDAWMQSGLDLSHWMTLQIVLHTEVAQWVQAALHHANRILLEQGLRPEIDLRPFIRRAPNTGVVAPRVGGPSGFFSTGGAGSLKGQNTHFEETRLLTQTPGLMRTPAQSMAVLGKLKQMVTRQVPGFSPTAPMTGTQPALALSPALKQAMFQADQADQAARRNTVPGGAEQASPAAVLQDMQRSKQALKQAATSPVERATIEIVALLFQHILTEERLPAAIRVWFARLQMPVLRVAVSEPDFFATISHPARALIDRMGSCVMGFHGGTPDQDDELHKEIRRIVQVVEAYPDTGRRVFQTVLTEFETFLEGYFRTQNEASRKGVSLAQQVEQRETWAIQYTIELRKMLDGVPVHEGVREFLFRVWADVLAHSAAQTSPSSEATRVLQKAAADLIWSASAKTSREERADVLRRLPPLLKIVREGMARAGLDVAKQDEHVQALNAALAAAFSARSATISSSHLKEVTERLESLDEILPDLASIELDEQTLRDLSGHESDDLEVVADGGTMPTPAMLSWARELQIGAWFQLDYRQRQEPVQLAWQGLQKQLVLFVTPNGRGVLFQLKRLAAFLQAGLLVPVEEESLTTRATREALAKLDADPQRLLS